MVHCGTRFCTFYHAGICGKMKSISLQQKSNTSTATQMPEEVHAAIEAFQMKRQDKLLMQVAEAARDAGDAELAVLAINNHMYLNAHIGNSINSGYQVGAQVPADELWGDILERICIKAKDPSVQAYMAAVGHALSLGHVDNEFAGESAVIGALFKGVKTSLAKRKLKSLSKKVLKIQKDIENLPKKIEDREVRNPIREAFNDLQKAIQTARGEDE